MRYSLGVVFCLTALLLSPPANADSASIIGTTPVNTSLKYAFDTGDGILVSAWDNTDEVAIIRHFDATTATFDDTKHPLPAGDNLFPHGFATFGSNGDATYVFAAYFPAGDDYLCGGLFANPCTRIFQYQPDTGAITEAGIPISTGVVAAYPLWIPTPPLDWGCVDGCFELWFNTGDLWSFDPVTQLTQDLGHQTDSVPDNGAGQTFVGDNCLYRLTDESLLKLDATGTMSVVTASLPTLVADTLDRGVATIGDEIIVHGGMLYDSDPWAGTDQIWRYDLNGDTWQQSTITAPKPGGYIASVATENGAFFFQDVHGTGPDDWEVLFDLVEYDLTNRHPLPPTITGPPTLVAGTAGTFTASTTDPDDNQIVYSWDFGDGEHDTGASSSHAFANAGSYTITVTASDDEGGAAQSTISVTVNAPPTAGGGSNKPPASTPPPAPNQAPTAAFTATGSILSASFNAAGSSDPDGDALTYAWTFGDGSTGTGRAPTHTYETAGSYTVELTVNDGENTASTTKPVQVTAPSAPIASVSLSAASIEEGGSITADGSGTTEGDGAHTFTWTLDGVFAGTGMTKTFTPSVGPHTVVLTVKNSYGQESTDSATFTVAAQPAPEPVEEPVEEVVEEPEPVQDTTADKESPTGILLIPALLGVALLMRRR